VTAFQVIVLIVSFTLEREQLPRLMVTLVLKLLLYVGAGKVVFFWEGEGKGREGKEREG